MSELAEVGREDGGDTVAIVLDCWLRRCVARFLMPSWSDDDMYPDDSVRIRTDMRACEVGDGELRWSSSPTVEGRSLLVGMSLAPCMYLHGHTYRQTMLELWMILGLLVCG